MTPPTPQKTLLLRLAEYPDIARAASVGCTAYMETPLYRFMYPHRHKHPKDFLRSMRSRIEQSLLAPNTVVLVVENPESREVVAFGVWIFFQAWDPEQQKKKKPKGLALEKNTLYYRFHRQYLTFENKFGHCFHRNNAIDYQNYASFFHTVTQEGPDLANGQASWRLVQLATHPSYQRRGAGSMVLNWGVERGEIDGVVVGLIAEPANVAFYLNRGFEVFGEEQKVGEVRWRIMRKLLVGGSAVVGV